jgi:hypothetical protein
MAQIKRSPKATKKSVADPSDSYIAIKPLWARSRAVLQGQTTAKLHDENVLDFADNLLVPFSTSMSQSQYDFFKAEAELPGLTAQYSKVLISALLRKQSLLDLPDEVPDNAKDWIENNFTLEGSSLFNFLDTALWEELQTSRGWVYVDYPEFSDGDWEEMDQEQRNMTSPYPVLIKAENVINVKTGMHPVTKTKTITRFVTRYLVERFSDDNPWHANLIDTVSDHYLDKNGSFAIDIYEAVGNADIVKVTNGEVAQEYNDSISKSFKKVGATIYPKSWGENIKEIPAWPLNGQIEPIEPILMPLIDREIALYNKVSRRNHLLMGAATYTPIVKADMTDEDFETLVGSGLGSWLRVGKDEDITVLATPTDALADMDRAIEATVQEMAKMGIRMLSPEQDSSGVALEIRNASQTAQLGALNSKVSGTMKEVIVFMINWKYNLDINSNDVTFQMSSDFSPMVGGEAAMRLVSEWYQAGIIPRSVFVNIAKYNDFLPADYDDEEATSEIQTDPLIDKVSDNEVVLDDA